MKIEAAFLVDDLTQRTKQHLQHAEELRQLDFEKLNWKESPESWSVLECIEHLNLYGDFYLPEIERRISTSKYARPTQLFKSGMLGNYFALSMLPKEKPNKMKTFKDKNPSGSKLGLATIDRFIEQQIKLLELLNKAKQVDLSKTKTAISISKLIKLRLGDTFRVVIYHNQRHLVQADNALKKQKTHAGR